MDGPSSVEHRYFSMKDYHAAAVYSHGLAIRTEEDADKIKAEIEELVSHRDPDNPELVIVKVESPCNEKYSVFNRRTMKPLDEGDVPTNVQQVALSHRVNGETKPIGPVIIEAFPNGKKFVLYDPRSSKYFKG